MSPNARSVERARFSWDHTSATAIWVQRYSESWGFRSAVPVVRFASAVSAGSSELAHPWRIVLPTVSVIDRVGALPARFIVCGSQSDGRRLTIADLSTTDRRPGSAGSVLICLRVRSEAEMRELLQQPDVLDSRRQSAVLVAIAETPALRAQCARLCDEVFDAKDDLLYAQLAVLTHDRGYSVAALKFLRAMCGRWGSACDTLFKLAVGTCFAVGSVKQAAACASVSRWTISRRLQEEAGTTPVRVFRFTSAAMAELLRSEVGWSTARIAREALRCDARALHRRHREVFGDTLLHMGPRSKGEAGSADLLQRVAARGDEFLRGVRTRITVPRLPMAADLRR